MNNLDNVEKEIVQSIMDSASDYTIDELTVFLKKSLQEALNSGKKISFTCAVAATLNLYVSVILGNQQKDLVLLTVKENLESAISQLANMGFIEVTREEAEKIIATLQAPVQQE